MNDKQNKLKTFIRISFAFIILAVLALAAITLVYLYVDEATYNLIVLLIMILVIIVIIIASFLVWIIRSAYKNNYINKRFVYIINLFLKKIMPICLDLGMALGIDKNIIREFYVDLNNILVLSSNPKTTNDKILILVPHCLQWSKCNYKITSDPYNCRRCGKCNINELISIAEKYNITLLVASGGTMARKAIVDNKPEVIISVACSRDLISGLMDVEHIPVIAIENCRPNGPCIDTNVDVGKIEAAINQVLIN